MGWFLPALFSAGSSLLGGILNKKSAKKQQQQAQNFAKENSITDLTKLRQVAEKAGFNPLTALMGGAGSPAASNYQASYNPAMSSGSFIADAMSRGSDAYFSYVDDQAAQAESIRRETEDKRRWEAEMANRPASQRFGYALSQQQEYRPQVRSAGPRMGSAVAASVVGTAAASEPSPSDGSVTPSRQAIMVRGTPFYPRSGSSDAEAAESRYGEVAGEIIGVDALIHDTAVHARSRTMMNRGTPITQYKTPKMLTPTDWRKYERPYNPHNLQKLSW